ncbi:MAG: APC family permease [Pirellulaceae bacterium]|nr:APC family permease [Pirellulaceae bacterium]
MPVSPPLPNEPPAATPPAQSPTGSSTPAQPPIGFVTLVMLVVASMIGIGCFFSSGYALLSLGNPGRVVLAWVLCGGWALAGAVAYGALARRVPLSGGEYLYLSRLMHPSIGFLAGWISLVAGFTAPIAAMSKAVVKYALPSIQDPNLAAGAASLVILAACVCHAAHVRVGAVAQNLIVIVKLSFIMVLLLWAGSLIGNDLAWQGDALPDRETAVWPASSMGWVALLASMSWISLSYTGFNAAVYVAGESASAQRNVPRAMLLATGLVMLLYVLMNAVFVYAPAGADVSQDPEGIAILAASALGGPTMNGLLRTIVSLAVLSSVFSMLLAGPRVYVQMASDGVMPQFLNANARVPRVAVFMQGLLSISVVWAASLEKLIGYLGMTLAACSALAVSALWCLNRSASTTRYAPVAWWEHLAATSYVVGTLGMLAAVVAEGQRRSELWAVGGTFALGLLIYIVWQTYQRQRPRSPTTD